MERVKLEEFIAEAYRRTAQNLRDLPPDIDDDHQYSRATPNRPSPGAGAVPGVTAFSPLHGILPCDVGGPADKPVPIGAGAGEERVGRAHPAAGERRAVAGAGQYVDHVRHGTTTLFTALKGATGIRSKGAIRRLWSRRCDQHRGRCWSFLDRLAAT